MEVKTRCWALVVAVLATVGISQGAQASPLPPNRLDLEDDPLSLEGIRRDQFDDVLDRMAFLFRPIFFHQGAELVIERHWDDGTVNAFADREGRRWLVKMYGGLARRHEITLDGFALVVCHEIGHHLGGYPFKTGSWAASEGESDYFATQVCARAFWRDDAAGNATFRTTAPEAVRQRCDAAWPQADRRDLCYRIAMAGKSLADLSATLEGNTVDFSRRDTSEVTTTLMSHPAAQCRLDTYVRGALCTVTPTVDVIPGLSNAVGPNSALAEVEAATWSCAPASAWLGTAGYNGQDRPRCWFKNQLTSGPP